MCEFIGFPKISRYSRDIIVTEKIDGTNAQVYIDEDKKTILACSRNRIITVKNDNYGFAKWVEENKTDLLRLGPGRHYGEWWGSKIGRGYGLSNGERKFSLFNTLKFSDNRPSCCDVVPVIWKGNFDNFRQDLSMKCLLENGSKASPGYMNPEGIVIFHTASGFMFKKTFENDDKGKNNVTIF